MLYAHPFIGRVSHNAASFGLIPRASLRIHAATILGGFAFEMAVSIALFKLLRRAGSISGVQASGVHFDRSASAVAVAALSRDIKGIKK